MFEFQSKAVISAEMSGRKVLSEENGIERKMEKNFAHTAPTVAQRWDTGLTIYRLWVQFQPDGLVFLLPSFPTFLHNIIECP